MTPPPELTAEGELEAKLFAAKRLEDPRQAVRVDWGKAWSDAGKGALDEVNAKLRVTLDRLGLAEVKAGTVKEFKAYPNGLQRLPEEGRLQFPDIFHNLADAAAVLADNPNDFTYTARLPYSEELDVVVQFESEEAGTICRDCSQSGADKKLSPGESCDRYRGEFDLRWEYHVHLVRPDHEFAPGCYNFTHFP